MKTSLIFAPGETPRLLFPSATLRVLPSRESMVAACCGARFDGKTEEPFGAAKVLDFVYLGLWNSGTVLSTGSLSEASVVTVVLMRGEEEVR